MNFVFLSPHFPRNFKYFVTAMKNHGINVLGIASEPYFNLDLELREALTEYYRVDDMEDYDQLLRACGFFTFKYGKIDFIESHNEHWLEKEAQLRTDFNIPGLKTADMPPIKRKSEMKKVFQRAKIPVARGEVINDITAAKKFIKKVGYPICAKPDIGVGAGGAFQISNDEELEHFFTIKPDVDYIMEEFISGDIHTFDGLVDRDGNILYLNSFIYGGVMEMVRDAIDTVYFNQFEIPADLMDVGLRAVKEFGIRNRFFHLEFFRTEENELVALEINVRPPGGWSVDIFNYACDISIFDLYAKMILGQEHLEKPEVKYHCAFVGVRYGLENELKHTNNDVLNKYGHVVAKNGLMPDIFADVMGNYCYVIRSKDLEELKAAAEFIISRRN
ncbi:MAG: ATP-grasp domain-containing protein [Bacillota bacterium]|jgi:biotin carboxylase|nr:ATP-grasp domain-containing protein [Bacillota bacterium]NLL26332.1 ATP-grasp domain-containing protein [Erysipelotrichia bacterium]